VTVVVKVMPAAKLPIREDQAVGFDTVLEPPNFLVGSDSGEISAPRFYRARERKLRREQKHLSRTRRDSRNRSQARRRVAQIHERTAKLRQEFLHQLSHFIVATWSVICFENLSLKSKTEHAKSWLDAAFGELLPQVKYKALWNSKYFVQVDRFCPSTQLCSECGYKNDDLSLSDQEWTCPRVSNVSNPPPAGLERCQKRESRRSEDGRRGTPGDGKLLWTASKPGGRQRRRLKQERIPVFRRGTVKWDSNLE
jgi:putative transposase